jgi:hypothetical protein
LAIATVVRTFQVTFKKFRHTYLKMIVKKFLEYHPWLVSKNISEPCAFSMFARCFISGIMRNVIQPKGNTLAAVSRHT